MSVAQIKMHFRNLITQQLELLGDKLSGNVV